MNLKYTTSFYRVLVSITIARLAQRPCRPSKPEDGGASERELSNSLVSAKPHRRPCLRPTSLARCSGRRRSSGRGRNGETMVTAPLRVSAPQSPYRDCDIFLVKLEHPTAPERLICTDVETGLIVGSPSVAPDRAPLATSHRGGGHPDDRRHLPSGLDRRRDRVGRVGQVVSSDLRRAAAQAAAVAAKKARSGFALIGTPYVNLTTLRLRPRSFAGSAVALPCRRGLGLPARIHRAPSWRSRPTIPTPSARRGCCRERARI
jgi:hypothetical protein